MAFTQAQLANLETAIATGVREVTYDGQKTVYGSLPEMLQLRDAMRRSLGVADSGRRFAAFDKGV